MLTVTGDGRSRGLAQGEEWRTRIHEVLMRVVDAIGGPAQTEHFVASTRCESAIATHTPDLLAEVDGIAEAAGVPRTHLLAHNLMDEHWWWSQTPGAALHRESCSTVAVASTPGLLGQTMDLGTLLDGSQDILRATAAGGSTVTVLTSTGLVGLCGMSDAGFAICVNALTMLEHSGSGLPVAFVLRGALAQPNAAAAVAFLRSVPHASGQHYAVVGKSPDHAVFTASLECSAFGAVDAAPANTGCAHANHPLASTDIDPSMVPEESRSELRQSVLDGRRSQLTTLDDLTDLLSSPPLCISRTDSDWFTFGAIAIEIGERPRMRYSLGPPADDGWQVVLD